jgi:hypothetical protein
MEEIITKEKAKELMKIKGETRGASIKGDLEYIISKKGKDGLEKVEEEMARLGYPIKYNEIRPMDFYPMGLEAISFSVIKKIFNFTDDKFREMGEFNSKVSLIVRLFMKYFVSLELVAKQAPKFWREYYTKGDLKIAEINKEKRYLIIRIDNFYHHPLHCLSIEGYLKTIVRIVVKGSVTCEETKCTYRGDDHHEFLVKW